MPSVMSKAIKSAQSSWGNNPLLLAISDGNIEHAKDLIRVNRELASRRINQYGYTVMHFICEVADAPTVKALVEVQPEYLCSLRDNERRNLLHIAAGKGKEEVLRALVTVCPNAIQELTSLAETPLHVALKNDRCGCFLVLIQQLQKLHFRWIDLLNRQDCDGNTVFHIAILHKQVQVLGVLLSFKLRNGDRVVDVNSINNLGQTPLDLYYQNMCDRNDKEISDILHEARAKKGHELRSCEGQGQPCCSQSVPSIAEKLMQENMDLMKKSLLLGVFIFIATAAYDSLFNLTSIYPLERHVEIFTISVKDAIWSPNLLPDIFYVIVANTITFLGSMSVIFGNTWSMASKCSLCYRAIPLLVTGAMLVSYGLAAKKIMPKFLITVGPHKIPSFLVAWLFDLHLVFFTVAAWLIGKQIFHVFSAT